MMKKSVGNLSKKTGDKYYEWLKTKKKFIKRNLIIKNTDFPTPKKKKEKRKWLWRWRRRKPNKK